MKFINELCKIFKIKSINSSEDINNTKEITYYSTDKNSFVTSRIPKHVKIVKKRHNSGSYNDYDINTYYKNKHISSDSYFIHYPKTIMNYKNKLQETGLTLENNGNIINKLYYTDEINSIDEVNSMNTTDSIDEVDSDDILNDYLFPDNEILIKIEQSKRSDINKFYNTLNNNYDNEISSIYSNIN